MPGGTRRVRASIDPYKFFMPQFSHSAGGVVLNVRGEVLVVQQRDLSWSLPKGRIQPEEDPRDAAVREIAEESGIRDVSLVKILRSYTRFSITNTGAEDRGRVRRLTMYLFTTVQEELRPMDPRIPAARWAAKEEVEQLLTHPRDQQFFREIIPELNLLLVG